MYSVVLMMAMAGGGDLPAEYGDGGCFGCSGWSCMGSCSGGSCMGSSCHGGHQHGHKGCCGGGHHFFGGGGHHSSCHGGHGGHHAHHSCHGGHGCCGGGDGCCGGGWSCMGSSCMGGSCMGGSCSGGSCMGGSCSGWSCSGGSSFGGCYGAGAGCYGAGAGAGCYGAGAGGYSAAPAIVGTHGAVASVQAPATIVVTLPAKARLTVDDEPTTSTSARRVFTSPALPPGKEYSYTLKAEFSKDGKPVVITKEVTVSAGKQVTVKLEANELSGVASR